MMLEKQAFIPARQFNVSSLKRAITSKSQLVYLIKYHDTNVGSAIIHVYEKTWRLYSLAVLQDFQNMGLGRILLSFLIDKAKGNNVVRFTLEVDAQEPKLIAWYQSFGFAIVEKLPDYYGDNIDGYKMELIIGHNHRKTINLIVTDQNLPWARHLKNVELTSAEVFLSNPRYQKDEFRVFNLCASYDHVNDDQIINEVDRLMYNAKKSGKARIASK